MRPAGWTACAWTGHRAGRSASGLLGARSMSRVFRTLRWPRLTHARLLSPGGAAVALLAILFTGCGHTPAAKGTKNPRVEVTEPVTGTVIDYQDFTGRLDAFRTVDIRARVAGYITDAPFKEGDDVTVGRLL